MSETQEGLTIPGYQPVAKLGEASSYGIWVRAIQTRMDRHVLLKLLPPGFATLHESFGREIQAMVRRAGDGVLPVIDEGETGGLRYLILDEAESVPLEELAAPLDPAGWYELARTLEGIYRAAADEGSVVLPIPRGAVRRRPNGDFCVAELGWVIPTGAAVPSDPRLPPELVGTPAAPGLNALFLGICLEGLGAQLPGRPPRQWSRGVADLLDSTGVPDSVPFPDASRFEWEPPEWRIPAPVVATLAVGLVALVAWVTLELLPVTPSPEPGPPPDPDPPTETRRSRSEEADLELRRLSGVDLKTAGEGLPVIVEKDRRDGLRALAEEYAETAAAGLAEELLELPAQERWDVILGGDGDPDVLTETQIRELAELQSAFPDSNTAASVTELLRTWPVIQELEAWELWEPKRDRVLADVAQGDLRSAMASLAVLVREPVHLSIRPQLRALGRQVRDAGDVQLRLLMEEVASDRQRGDYATAQQRIDACLLPPPWNHGLAALRVSLQAELRGLAQLEGAVRAVFAATGQGDWQGAADLLAGLSPADDQPGFASRHRRWTAWFRRARRTHDQLVASLRSLEESSRVRTFRLSWPDESVRGRVVGLTRNGFQLKPAGLRVALNLPLARIPVAEAMEMIPGGEVTEPDVALLQVFLGKSRRGLAIVRERDPAPEWVAAIDALTRQIQADRLREVITRGREAALRKEWSGTRAVLEELRSGFEPREFASYRSELMGWVLAEFESKGPAAAFGGASRVQYVEGPTEEGPTEEGSGVLEIEYDFTKVEDLRDWRGSRPEDRLDLARGRLRVRGAVCLYPSDSPDSLIFEDRLEVDVAFRSASHRTPNLNVVLWSRSPEEPSAGVLFGLGWKPPGLNSFNEEGKPQILLPANLIGTLADIERGDYDAVRWYQISPVPQRNVSLGVSSDADRSALSWKEVSLLQGCENFATAGERRGTVELRSYDSELQVRRLTIRGKLRSEWWEEWRVRRAAREVPQ